MGGQQDPGGDGPPRRPPCEDWTVRDLVNHLIQAQQLFAGADDGSPAASPWGRPPELLGEGPAAEYEQGRQTTLAAFSRPGRLGRLAGRAS
jgi:Mycothiol maleylpyruvate isomerase N-terminal domain